MMTNFLHDPAHASSLPVLLLDEHPIITAAVSYYLSKSPEFFICGQSHSIADAARHMAARSPVILMTELEFKGQDGLAWIKNVTKGGKAIKVVVFTSLDPAIYTERALRAGAQGFVSKHEDPAYLLKALRAVRDGQVYAEPAQLQKLARESVSAHRRFTGQAPWQKLADRELHVLKLLGSGRSTKEIAQTMIISRKTVEAHRSHMMQKLKITSGRHLTRLATLWFGKSRSPATPLFTLRAGAKAHCPWPDSNRHEE